MNRSNAAMRWMRWAWIAVLLLATCLALGPALPGGAAPGVEAQALAESFTVSGTVTCGGSGKSGVQVFAWNRDLGAGEVADTTDSRGAYSVTLETGSYDLIFNPPCDSGCVTDSLKGITGPADQTRDISLPEGYGVSGTVRAASTQQAVGNVAIYVYNTETFAASGLPPTNAGGRYCLGLASGLYRITFTPPPCLGLGPHTATVEVRAGVTRDVGLPAGFTVAGRITDGEGRGVSGAQIYAHQCVPGVTGYGFSPSDASGYYTGTLPLGVYGILFMPPPDRGLGPVPQTGVKDQDGGCPDTTLHITLPAGAKLSGQVTCAGQPLKNAFVYADPLDVNLCEGLDGVGGYTVDNGSYALPVVPGDYRIAIAPPLASPFNPRTFERAITHNETLNLDYCMLSLPLILKNRPLP